MRHHLCSADRDSNLFLNNWLPDKMADKDKFWANTRPLCSSQNRC